MNIELRGIEEALARLRVDLNATAEKIVSEVTNQMELKAKENIDQRVYSQAPSASYRRTGRAKRGILKFNKGTRGQVIASTKKAGAGREYAPFLNRNRKIKRLNTLFWDDAVADTLKVAEEKAKEILNKALKK